MKACMLTTVDNPYNPFDDWDAWYAYDHLKGYHTPGMLARIANMSDELSEIDNNLEICYAVDEIVKENVTGMYRKLERDIPDEL